MACFHVIDARTMVSEGKTLQQAFKECGRFPMMMIQMINVGEATGTLDEMLSKLASFFDEEVEAAVAALMSALEPAMLILIGFLLGMSILTTLGVILLVVGVVLMVLGSTGREIGGRRHYY